MAKNKRKGNNKSKQGQKKQKGQESGSNGKWKNWKLIVKESKRFEEYYKNQNGVIPPEEFENFMETLRTPLPTTFRVTRNTLYESEVKDVLQNKFATQSPLKLTEEVVIQPPKAIDWYPDHGGWVFNASRKDLRSAAEFDNFHQFLTIQGNAGNISRQEAVSMIPVLFLDVLPHHKVLDMCAAPGSKTAQIIECLHANDKVEPPTGLVIANDADGNRCYTLTHQIGRLGSPCAIVTNHEAQMFPYIKVPLQPGEVALEGVNREGLVDFQFDRILADVPCSSDGTFRKNIELWDSWVVQSSMGLHTLQFRIAQRGSQLLKVGGRMVYSTCSLNPLEDEAVVANIIRRTQGSLQLVDVSNELPNLKRKPGIKHWRVMDRDGTWYNTHEELPTERALKMPKTLFPPTEEEASEMHLERCMRILPHLQDTGGFFVAVFEKVKPLPDRVQHKPPTVATTTTATTEATTITTTETKTEEEDEDSKPLNLSEFDIPKIADEADVPLPKTEVTENAGEQTSESKEENKPRYKKGGEEPFRPFPSDRLDVFNKLREFYSINDKFPIPQLWVRSERKLKNLYVLSKDASTYLKADNNQVLRIINAGIRAFSLHEGKGLHCEYRLMQEGLPVIFPYMSNRVIDITEKDMLNLLNNKSPFTSSFSLPARGKLEPLIDGCVALHVKAETKKHWDGRRFVGWKGKYTTHLLLSREDLAALHNLLSISFPELVVRQSAPKKEKKSLEEIRATSESSTNGEETTNNEAATETKAEAMETEVVKS